MQLLSTAVTTGSENIAILTIFLKQSEPILGKEIPLSCQCLDRPIFQDQPNVQH